MPGQTLNTTTCFKIGRGGNPGSGTNGGLGGASSYAKGGDGGPGPTAVVVVAVPLPFMMKQQVNILSLLLAVAAVVVVAPVVHLIC